MVNLPPKLPINSDPPLETFGIAGAELLVQRDDLIHPLISGNKWRKLLGWLRRARDEHASGLITYGGAFSNHLVATACAAEAAGLAAAGILRGEEPRENAWLRAAQDCGMTLCPVSRSLYRDKAAALREVRARQPAMFPDWEKVLVVPEGGSGPEGQEGFRTLVESWLARGIRPAAVMHASATGTTAAGLARALETCGLQTRVLAVPVLRNLPEQQETVRAAGVDHSVTWLTGFDAGGHARTSPALRQFMEETAPGLPFPVEPVYTGKALHALTILLRDGALSPDGLIFLHTGGCLE